MAEQLTVNQLVVGSNPTRGAHLNTNPKILVKMAAITNEKIQKLQANFGEFIDYKKGWLMFKEAFVSSDGKIVLDPKESNSPSVALP